MIDRRHIESEEAKMRDLRRIVDECAAALRDPKVGRDEALAKIEATRKKALGLFPDKSDQFELIYRPRFNRIIDERFGKGSFTISPTNTA